MNRYHATVNMLIYAQDEYDAKWANDAQKLSESGDLLLEECHKVIKASGYKGEDIGVKVVDFANYARRIIEHVNDNVMSMIEKRIEGA